METFIGQFDRGSGWYIVVDEDSRDCGEGPWTSREDAQTFLDAEVGVPAHVERRDES